MMYSSQFPRGHLMGMGQGDYCLGPAGNVISCASSNVMATLPALPGGGQIPSGQNIQTAAPSYLQTPVTTATPAVTTAPLSTFATYAPYLAAGLFVFILASQPVSRRPAAAAAPAAPSPKRRRRGRN